MAAKKQKSSQSSHELKGSKIFEHFRSIGRIIDECPFAVQNRGGVYFVTASIGKSFHIYNVDTLGLEFVSPELDGKICALATHDDDTFVGTEKGSLYRLERAVIKERISVEQPILGMEVLGDVIIVLCKTSLLVMSLDLKKIACRLAFASEASRMLHPATYLNKILIGFANGGLQLWNFRSEKLIYEFSYGTGTSVTALAQAPVLDVAAVGFANGQILLVDLKQDRVLFTLQSKKSVCAIAFRSDAAAGAENKPQLAVGGEDGILSVWNLETRTLDLTMEAHERAFTSLFFLPGQPILLSAARDNSLKEWIFEQEECRSLRSRSGHIEPPTIVRFYDGHSVLSSGADQSLRMSSLLKDSQSHELSQGNIQSKARKLNISSSELKLAPITAFEAFTGKELKWDNLITAHAGASIARTWRVDRKRVGEHELKADGPVTALALTPCGNFGLVGSQSGLIDMFNMQSGQHRKKFSCDGALVGLAVDQLGKELLAVTHTGQVRVFSMAKAKVLAEQQLEGQVTCFAFKADNGLAAIATDRALILVFDMEARRTVRRLKGHTSTISSLSFSADGKWLVSCSADGTIRTWDLPSGLQLDAFASPTEPVSVSFSPSGDFLVSAHKADLALHLWWNRSVLSPLRLEHAQLHTYALPSNVCANDLVTLSSKSKWLSILRLDAIKAASKPSLPAANDQPLPFLLDALSIKRASDGLEINVEEKPLMAGELEKLLASDGDILAYLSGAGASQVHLDISSLPPSQFSPFLRFLAQAIRAKQNFELLQSYLAIFLQAHQAYLHSHKEEHAEALREALEAQEAVWSGLEGLLQQALCLTAFCRDRHH